MFIYIISNICILYKKKLIKKYIFLQYKKKILIKSEFNLLYLNFKYLFKILSLYIMFY